MPLPKPKDGEKKDKFLDRCMGDSVMTDEYPDNKQRYAVCLSLWGKKEEKKMDTDFEMRKAIAVHHTSTSGNTWDGPANEARLKADQEPSYYRKAFAWQDPDGDPKTKAAYRFIHHEVDGDGNIGAANIKACQTGIGVLNGARGGTTIPVADKKGVWNHLAAHIRDADLEPAELKSFEDGTVERRAFPLTEIRIEERNGKMPKIIGHTAVFGKLSVKLGFYHEKVRKGAFKKTIAEADVRALWNHDPNYVLGRNKSGTLRLEEDDIGLKVEIDPPDTTWARDLVTTIQRKDVDQMSFSFWPVIEEWDESDPNNLLRELVEVKLFDVSPVTFPAYPDTDVGVRSILEKAKIDFTALSRAVGKNIYGMPLSTEEMAVIKNTIEILQGIDGPAQEDHPGVPAEAGYRLQNLKKRLELLEKSL